MSISVIVPARNDLAETKSAIVSIIDACDELRLPCQLILIDDCSEDSEGLAPFFRSLKLPEPHRLVRIRTREREHYTGVFTLGLCLAEAERVLFVSNDMLMTASFLRTVLAVSALSDSIGIVRGTAEHVDSHPEHGLSPPIALNVRQMREFSRAMAQLRGLEFVTDRVLSGDAVLIKRSVIDKVGVLDTRFYGYFGDVDYGMRVQLAGFRLVCAKGAWLHHSGAGHLRREAQVRQVDITTVHAERMHLVAKAFTVFREKWGFATPTEFPGNMRFDLGAIAEGGRGRVALLQAPPANWRESFVLLSASMEPRAGMQPPNAVNRRSRP